MQHIKWNEKCDYETLEPGDQIEVWLDGKVYPTYIDEHGTQRFKENEVIRHLRDEGLLDLNKLAIDYIRHKKFSQRSYAELNMMLGYSLSGFSELHNFWDMQLINPVWDYDQPDDTYLYAAFGTGKKTKDEVTKALMERDGLTEMEAKDAMIEHLEIYGTGME